MNWANDCGDSRLLASRHSNNGSNINNSAPLTRCRIDTNAGSGRRISSKFKCLGRLVGMSIWFLVEDHQRAETAGRATSVITVATPDVT